MSAPHTAQAALCASAIDPALLATAQRKARAGEPNTRAEKRQLALEAERCQSVVLARHYGEEA